MKSTKELIGPAMTKTRPAEKPTIDIDAWAQVFRFKINGTADERVQLRKMVEECARFIDDIRNRQRPRWLSLLGSSFTGKTYLARAVWMWYRQSEHWNEGFGETMYPGQWCNWPELAGHLQRNEWTGLLDDLGTDRVVVIDEIGADRDKNGHVRDCLARLCSQRVGRWTIITSNMSLPDIETHIDKRVSSRMLRDGSVVVDVKTREFNMRK